MPSAGLTPQAIAGQALKKLRAQADPERARQVQRYFKETVRSFGVASPAVRAIAAELDRQGVPTKAGKGKWQRSTIQRLVARGAA